MAAKKGNKYAQGCKTSGAPRTVSLPEPDMIALGKEMIEWLKIHPEALHLTAWYSIVKGFTFKQWDTMTQKQEFIPYYEQALNIVGQKYLDKSSNVREGISQRWQRLYFKDLKKLEDQDANDDADRKKSIEATKPAVTNVYVKSDGLGCGADVPTSPISIATNQSPK